MSPDLRDKAEQLDLDYAEIERKADKAESIAEEKGMRLYNRKIIPYFDMNGLIVNTESVDYSTHDNVKEAMSFLNKVAEVRLSMLSGWDIRTLQFVAEERLGIEMDYVGELESVAVIDRDQHLTVDADYDEIVDFQKNCF